MKGVSISSERYPVMLNLSYLNLWTFPFTLS